LSSCFFFFTAPATTEIYTLSLHDALPILVVVGDETRGQVEPERLDKAKAHQDRAERHRQIDDPHRHFEIGRGLAAVVDVPDKVRSEEHTSELQSRENLVCRLLLEKKKKNA